MQGSPTDLTRSGVDLQKLIGVEVKLPKEEPADKLGRNLLSLSRRNSTRSISSASLCSSAGGSVFEDIESDGEISDEETGMEASSKGKVKGSIPVNYFKAGAHWSVLSIIIMLFLIVQVFASAADYWVSYW